MAVSVSTVRAPSSERVGVLAGIGAYAMWGVFPLVFHRLRSVGPLEILLHRVTWSFVLVAALLAVRRRGAWVRAAVADRRLLGRIVAATLFVAVNWLVYIWAVDRGAVVEAALGYYINPLLTVGLGVLVLHERLRRLQVTALGLGAVAVAILTAAYGRPPWIAVALAVSFAGYGFMKRSIGIGAVESLALETAVLLPVSVGGLVLLELRGTGALGHGSAGRDALLVGLGLVTAVPLVLFGAAASRIPLSLLGLLQYLTPTLQLACGVVLLGEPLPPARLAGFVVVWLALGVLALDAVRRLRRTGTVDDPASLAVVEPA